MCSEFENCLYYIDSEYRILRYNDSMKKMYPEVEVGRHCYKAIVLRDSVCSNCPIHAKEKQSVFYNRERHEWIHAHAAKTELPDIGNCYAVMFSIKYRNEMQINYYIESLNDTNIYLLESLERGKYYRRQLKDALDNAEAANRAKTTFLFNMSHDIRTPMNAIIGFTKICEANVHDSEKVAYCISKIEESSSHLLKMLNDILDMSRISSGKFVIDEHSCNFIEFINGLEDMVRVEMQSHNLNFIVDTSGIKYKYLYCDTLHVGQIILNLLSNAMKFNSEGGYVWLTISQEAGSDENISKTIISVKDSGIGMHEEYMKRIFTPFEKEDVRHSDDKPNGVGLGLAITKKITDALNGEIKVTSTPGTGSEFIVILNLKKSDQPESSVNDEDLTNVRFDGKRALLVEDNTLNREVASELLGDLGLEIEEAVNGREAVSMVENNPEGYYDVIFMDIQMPLMNGYEATKMIRTLPREDVKKLTILAMTANAFEEDIKNCMDSGMNGHIAKPIDVGNIVRTLKKYII